jgi:hypothetical protein
VRHLALFLTLCACGSGRLINTFDPSQHPDASMEPPDAGGADVDSGTPDAGPIDEEPFDAGAGVSCSIDGWCKDAVRPDGGPLVSQHLRGVFARTPTEVYVVGDQGTLLIYDGVGWHLGPAGGPADDLYAVWANASDDVWVAGFSGSEDDPNGVYAHFNGIEFDHIYKPLSKGPQSLFGTGPNDMWAVCGGGEIRHFTGTNWLLQGSMTTQALASITGLNGQLWAAGASGTLLQYSASTGWSPMAAPVGTLSGLGSLLAFSPSQIFAVGGNEWLEYDGQAWTQRAFPAALDLELLGLWGPTAQGLWGVGPSGKAWRFENGVGDWSVTDTQELLRAIHGTDEQHVWAVGFNGTVLRRLHR